MADGRSGQRPTRRAKLKRKYPTALWVSTGSRRTRKPHRGRPRRADAAPPPAPPAWIGDGLRGRHRGRPGRQASPPAVATNGWPPGGERARRRAAMAGGPYGATAPTAARVVGNGTARRHRAPLEGAPRAHARAASRACSAAERPRGRAGVRSHWRMRVGPVVLALGALSPLLPLPHRRQRTPPRVTPPIYARQRRHQSRPPLCCRGGRRCSSAPPPGSPSSRTPPAAPVLQNGRPARECWMPAICDRIPKTRFCQTPTLPTHIVAGSSFGRQDKVHHCI